MLGLMQTNLRHPSLNTHKFDAIESPFGAEVFESYAQNKTPGACRVGYFGVMAQVAVNYILLPSRSTHRVNLLSNGRLCLG
jgi:hypothetical protein